MLKKSSTGQGWDKANDLGLSWEGGFGRFPKVPQKSRRTPISQHVYSGHISELPWRCAEHDARVMEPRSQRRLLILFLSIFKEGTMVVSLPPSLHPCHLHFIESTGCSDFENEP